MHGLENNPLDDTIRALVGARGPGKSICPSEVARAEAPERWRPLMGRVRLRAIALAKAGEISILRKGKPVDPDDFKGVYRLSLPR